MEPTILTSVTGTRAVELAERAAAVRDELRAASDHLADARQWLFPDGANPRSRWPVVAFEHPNPRVGTIARTTPGERSLILAENALFSAADAAAEVFGRGDGTAFGRSLHAQMKQVQGLGYGTEHVANMHLRAKLSPELRIDASDLSIDRDARRQLDALARRVDAAAATFDAAHGAYLTQA